MKMHKGEVVLDVSTVKAMVQEQFPKYADLPIEKGNYFGTVNTIFRLGHKFAIRIPKREAGVNQINKERIWLDRLSNSLSLRIPKLIEVGKTSHQFPQIWAIYDWIEGEDWTRANLGDITDNIEILSSFIKALQQIKAEPQLNPGDHNYWRGEALANRDAITRETIPKLKGIVNPQIANSIWAEGLAQPVKQEDKAWIHGDLKPGNILARNGKIVSVIDFGALGFGDTACDLMLGWNFFNSAERAIFKQKMSVSESVWKRARAWSLSVAMVALEYYIDTNPELAQTSRYTLTEIEQEWKGQ